VADAAGISPEDGNELGELLARMRRSRNVSGAKLGKIVGISQPTVSRLENGIGLPDPHVVAQIASALGAGDAETRHLVDLAEQAHNRMTDWRPVALLSMGQRNVAQWEANADELRFFEPSVIPGLLQTTEYARAVLSSFQELLAPGSPGRREAAVSEAVSARVQRQEVLADQRKRFYFLIGEGVLRHLICPPEMMAAQISRLREVAKQDNVSVDIIPTDSRWEMVPLHGFTLFDATSVSIDLYNTGLTSRGKADAAVYRRVFDTLARHAVPEFESFLDRHLDHYLQLSRTRA
jgi:transcriptional regulator with XRE-family HTH domain